METRNKPASRKRGARSYERASTTESKMASKKQEQPVASGHEATLERFAGVGQVSQDDYLLREKETLTAFNRQLSAPRNGILSGPEGPPATPAGAPDGTTGTFGT